VKVPQFALAESDTLLSYIRLRSVVGAENVQRRVEKFVADLEQFPFIGTPVGHAGVRMLVATPFPCLVYYVVREAEGDIIVVDIRHGARDRDG
jgi:plasmid stabilization system protein ParE